MPMIETTTICRTPARAPSSCRLRVAAVKKSVPSSSSTSTTWRPTLPVAPATAIFPRASISPPFSFDQAQRSDRAREQQRFASWAHPGPNRSVSAVPLEGRPPAGELGAGRFGERGRELRARTDRELAVDARQVNLDRPLGDEERLGDLSVGEPFCRQLGDAPLARRERVDAAEGETPGRAPVASSSRSARATISVAPQVVASATAWGSCSRAGGGGWLCEVPPRAQCAPSRAPASRASHRAPAPLP